MKKILLLATTHIAALALGFGLGVYFLPILVAERAPDAATLAAAAKSAAYTATFKWTCRAATLCIGARARSA